MNVRLNKFHEYSRHPWLSRIYKKLTVEEKSLAENYLQKHKLLSKHEFATLLNQLFIDDPVKPQHWKELHELLSSANSAC